MDQVSEMLHKLAADGVCFPSELVKIENNNRATTVAHLGAKIWFLTLIFQNEDTSSELPIVVKSLDEDAERVKFGTKTQFVNEVAMYNEILPFLGAIDSQITPKPYYSCTPSDDAAQYFVVMEDLTHRGFEDVNTPFLDEQHILMILKTLGRFHGLSYKVNKSDPGKLASLCKMLRAVRRCGSSFKEGIRAAQIRGFQPVIDENRGNPIVKEVFDRITTLSLDEQRAMLTKPEEPFAVALHGDVARDNILFQKDEDGNVKTVNLFDFGFSSYGDSTTDVSFFLYLHTDQDARLKHWDDFLRAYWDGVLSVEENPGFTFDDFLRNFSKKAVYGFLNAAFFLPLLLDENRQKSATEYLDMKSEEDWVNWGLTMGGEEATVATSNILRHMLARGYLAEFVKGY